MMTPPIEGTHLGKPTPYPARYAPELLVAVPRAGNRMRYGILDANLPFVGSDVWHGWEAGFLTDTGLPVVGILKLVYPCQSQCIVESKSLKLYLNSLNMEKLGATVDEAIHTFMTRVRHDLSRLLNTSIDTSFFRDGGGTLTDFPDYTVLENLPVCSDGPFADHRENPSLLGPDKFMGESAPRELRVGTHLLRSNCKITHQPDWGSVFIRMSGSRLPTENALLKYIVSFRNEHHFHEEVCEMIYKRLFDIFSPTALAVTCIYTRRGGIDICPTRASAVELLPKNLLSSKTLTQKMPRQ